MSIKITTDAFIEKAFIKHGNRFNYSDVDYKSNKKLVIIKCNKHNLIFNQTPSNHLNGYGGCLMCKQELVTKSSTNYIKEVSQIHNNFYIYDKTIYTKAFDSVIITCPIHGDFKQVAKDHYKNGCTACGINKRTDLLRYDTKNFKDKAQEVHGDKYDYSSVNYINSIKKVAIKCKIHGTFKQSPVCHMGGSGCSICGYIGNGGYSRSDFIKRANGRHGTLYLLHWKNEKQECFYKIGIWSFYK